LLPEFWAANRILNKFETYAGKKITPFQVNWELIFTAIWTNYCQLENRPILPQGEFMDLLSALNQLAVDIISEPLNNMNNKDYETRLQWIISHRDPEDCKDFGMLSDRWAKQLPKDQKDCFAWRIEDARDYLNSFFKKYSLENMKNALELFLIEAFAGFANDLVKNDLLSQCSFCGEYFHFQKGKKYCSLTNEGKDCGKKARFRRYYLKSKQKP